jgi:hypothetical protein
MQFLVQMFEVVAGLHAESLKVAPFQLKILG